MKNIFNWTFFGLGFLFLLGQIFLGEEHSMYMDIFYLVITFTAVITGWFASRKFGWKSLHGGAFGLMWVGVLMWFLGEVVWTYFARVLDIDPYPSFADVLFLLGYVFMFLGLFRELRHTGMKSLKKNFLTLVMIVLVGLTLLTIVGYFGVYYAYDPDAALLENVVAMAYGVGDLILVFGSLVTLVVLSEYKGGKVLSVWYWLLAAFMVTLAADVLYSIYYPQYEEGLKPYIYMNSIWVISYLSMAVGYQNGYILISNIQSKLSKK